MSLVVKRVKYSIFHCRGVDVKKGDGLTLYYDATGLRMPYPWFMAMTHSDEWESCMQWCERMLEHDLVGIATSGDLLVKTPGFPEEGELRDSPVTARRSMSPVWEQSSKTEEEQASEYVTQMDLFFDAITEHLVPRECSPRWIRVQQFQSFLNPFDLVAVP